MKKISKKDIGTLVDVIGQHVERYWVLMTIILSIISLSAVCFMIIWNVSTDVVPFEDEVAYYVGQGSLIAITTATMILLFLSKKKVISAKAIAIIFHIYAFLLMAWATLSFVFDLSLGFPDVIYLLLFTIIAGLFIVEPIFYSVCAFISLTIVFLTSLLGYENVYEGNLVAENLVNVAAFILTVVTIAYRNYRVTMSEFKYAKKLEELSYVDELTGLLNERSYIQETESINNDIKAGKDIKFAVILMDVNNLKATNDAYGHRYGCSLIVRCGHTLPTLFTSTKLFHVGGDEFVAIVKGKDYDEFEKTMERFDEALLYSLVEYEGVQLIFSVARGYAKYEKGMFYKDVLQIADKAMYENKKYLKEKYNMKSR